MSTKRYQDPKWAASQALSLDYNYAMADFVGDHGLTEADLAKPDPRPGGPGAGNRPRAGQNGRLGFMELPYQTEVLKEIRKLGKPILEWCWDFVVLGIGGSALGARALQQALLHPQHNLFPMGRRQHRPALWVRTISTPIICFGIAGRPGPQAHRLQRHQQVGQSTAETLAQFLWIYQILKDRVGEDKARERLIVTTDPDKGPLRRLAAKEGFASLSVPPNVGGRFSVLSAVGLLPAPLVGIDLEELLAGARFMDQRLKETTLSTWPTAWRRSFICLPPASSGPSW